MSFLCLLIGCILIAMGFLVQFLGLFVIGTGLPLFTIAMGILFFFGACLIGYANSRKEK